MVVPMVSVSPRLPSRAERLLAQLGWPILAIALVALGLALAFPRVLAPAEDGAPLRITEALGQAVVAGVVTFATVPLVVRYANRRGMTVRDSHKPVERRVPVGGGIALLAGVGIAAFLAAPPLLVAVVALPAVLFGILGVIDDARGVPRSVRVGASLVLSLPAAFYGASAMADSAGDLLARIGVSFTVALVVGAFLALLVVMFFANSVNLMGGYDGIIPTWTLVSVVALGAATWMHGDRAMLPLLVVMAASAVAYLRFDAAPSRLLVGNSGTHFVGLFLGAYFVAAKIPLVFLVLFVPNLVEFCLYWGFSLMSRHKNRVNLARYDAEADRLRPIRGRVESFYQAILQTFHLRTERQLSYIASLVILSYYGAVFVVLEA